MNKKVKNERIDFFNDEKKMMDFYSLSKEKFSDKEKIGYEATLNREKDIVAAIKVVKSILCTEEFKLGIKNIDDEPYFYLVNYEGLANLGDIESETFDNLACVIDRLENYHNDYFLEAYCDKTYNKYGQEIVSEYALPYWILLNSDFFAELLSDITPFVYTHFTNEGPDAVEGNHSLLNDFHEDVEYLVYKNIAEKVIGNQSAYTMVEKDGKIYLSCYGYEGDIYSFYDLISKEGNEDLYTVYDNYKEVVDAEKQQIFNDLSDLGSEEHYLSYYEFEYIGYVKDYYKVKEKEVMESSLTKEDLIRIIEKLPFKDKDDIYRHLWSSYLRKDVVGYCEEKNISLSDEDIDNIVNLYVNEGRYDCNIAYWDNIASLVDEISVDKELVISSVDDIISYLDKRGISVEKLPHLEYSEWELRWYSDAGEDMVENINHFNTPTSIIQAIRTLANDFDPEEHAKLYAENAGNDGIPELKDLIEDAYSIKKFLTEIADELNNAKASE